MDKQFSIVQVRILILKNLW